MASVSLSRRESPVGTEDPPARADARDAIPRSLTELANHHGTDKGTIGPSRSWGAWNYTDIYEGYFQHHRSVPISILEIGLGVKGDRWAAMIVHGRNAEGGASLKLWHDYFPHAKLYGIDLNPAPYLDNDRTQTFVTDQGNPDRPSGRAG